MKYLFFTIIIIIVLVFIVRRKDKYKIINTNELHSISFAYPTQRFMLYKNIRDNNIIDKKSFSYIIPGKSKYNFTNENEYIKHYSQCYYALTSKKAGWDCLRHYEIIASGCVPYFLDIDNIPLNTMKTFPKELVKSAMNLTGVPKEHEVLNCIKNGYEININYELFDLKKYEEIRNKILSHFERYCLTNNLCKIIFPSNYVSVFSKNSGGPQDYQRDLLVISLLENEHNVTTNFDIDFIFDDYTGDTLKLYGRGMTYTKCLSSVLKKLHTLSMKTDIDDDMVIFCTKSNSNILNIDNYKISDKTIVVELDGNDLEYVDPKKHIKTHRKYMRES
jgi:hypothetical protein